MRHRGVAAVAASVAVVATEDAAALDVAEDAAAVVAGCGLAWDQVHYFHPLKHPLVDPRGVG